MSRAGPEMCFPPGMRARRLLPCTALLVAWLSPGLAAAQGGGAPAFSSPAEEIASLEDALSRKATQLSADCGSACSTLASMGRVVARICTLDPGAHCAAARARLEEATGRVRGTCGACAIPAQDDHGGEKQREVMKEEAPPQPVQPVQPAVSPGEPQLAYAAPPRGGCAGCSVPGGDEGGPGAALAVAGLSLLLARRPRRGITYRRR